jgi:serine phosphatase RsbU (regulator of sigma subunit)
VLLLGDVEGHGMASAAQMGQLRAAAAALVLEGHQPAAALTRLAAGAAQILEIGLATLLVVALDPASRRITLASAGHPPAVIKEPGAPARLSGLRPGPPLGAGPGRIPQAEQTLPAGSVLVLYSDGLVERRGEDLDVGLHRLRDAVDRATGLTSDVEDIADHLLHDLGCTDGGDDDIALLVLR